jgi:hypothetical protein
MRGGFETNGCAGARLFAADCDDQRHENDVRHGRQLLSKFTT